MAYDPQVIKRAKERLAERRNHAAGEAALLHDRVCKQFPRAREIEKELTAAVPEVTRIILQGGDPVAVEKVKQQNMALQAELSSLLRHAGYDRENFEPRYTCTQCGDTGYVNGEPCECFRQLLKEEACARLSGLSALKLTRFEELDLSYYDAANDPKLGTSVRRRMTDIIAYCRAYADGFSPEAESLLLQGATGTGKTHLSLAVARTVAEKGFGVIYGSLQPLLRKMENEHFGKSEGDSEEQLLGCDLLILDDLGMEFDSPFYRSCIYNLLNARLLEQRPTIISTNLGFVALQERYGDQIVSRITGGYTPLICVGKDIRQMRREQAMH